MKKLIQILNSEMKNEFIASGYFAAMLFTYCIVLLISGKHSISISTVFEMFLLNYVLTYLHRFLLNDEKDYSSKSFLIRAVILTTLSLGATICVSLIFGWFSDLPEWTSLLIYAMLIAAYITVWWLSKLRKKYDTIKLNEELAHFNSNLKQ